MPFASCTSSLVKTDHFTMSPTQPMTLLCIACYFKGGAFLKAAKAQGCRVLLVTSQHLEHEPWPWEAIDDIFYMPEHGDEWKMADLINSVSYIARREKLDRIVALDDFDVERAAALREHLRVPGLGDTRTRYFRDKLAMRAQAAEYGIAVPAYEHVLNYDRLRDYLNRETGPWVLKPRLQASATGIKKINHADELWPHLEKLGDEQSFYLIERFVPGDIYHVDSIIYEGKVVFARAHRYSDTPMQVAHEGGVFATHTVEYGSAEEEALLGQNRLVMAAMGLRSGVSHTEFIKAHADGTYYFLETSARVGGANIAEMLEASSGINLWEEWAKIEALGEGETYVLPPVRNDHSGILVTLARQEYPDTSAYDDPEIVWRMDKRHHVGLIIRSEKQERVLDLMERYTQRFYADFFATQPLPDKPTS